MQGTCDSDHDLWVEVGLDLLRRVSNQDVHVVVRDCEKLRMLSACVRGRSEAADEQRTDRACGRRRDVLE